MNGAIPRKEIIVRYLLIILSLILFLFLSLWVSQSRAADLYF